MNSLTWVHVSYLYIPSYKGIKGITSEHLLFNLNRKNSLVVYDQYKRRLDQMSP